jgi:hypothetical protein
MSKTKNYFTQVTEDAILQYNQSNDNIERNKIYTKHIYPAVNKISENLLHRYKFKVQHESIEDIKHTVQAHIFTKIDKINPSKGRSFSYLTKSIYVTLIQLSQKSYKRQISKCDVSEVDEENLDNKKYVLNDYFNNEMVVDYFSEKFIDYAQQNLATIYNGKKNEIICANAILHILRSSKDLDFFDKKSLYIYIRNMVKVSPQKFALVLKTLKNCYFETHDRYEVQFDNIIEDNFEEEFLDEDNDEYDELYNTISDKDLEEICEELDF